MNDIAFSVLPVSERMTRLLNVSRGKTVKFTGPSSMMLKSSLLYNNSPDSAAIQPHFMVRSSNYFHSLFDPLVIKGQPLLSVDTTYTFSRPRIQWQKDYYVVHVRYDCCLNDAVKINVEESSREGGTEMLCRVMWDRDQRQRNGRAIKEHAQRRPRVRLGVEEDIRW